MALRLNASAVYSCAKVSVHHRTYNSRLYPKAIRIHKNTATIRCITGNAADQPDNASKLSFVSVMDKARSLWESFPDPVKTFPWNKTMDNFTQLIIDIALTVFKYLWLPLFIVTCISEMSYCAHERKLFLIPFPFLLGLAIAGVLRDAALESSPYLNNAEVPWHLIGIAILFVLLKLAGPYYPYWGRIFIPHVANGALWRIVWSMFRRKKTLNVAQNLDTV